MKINKACKIEIIASGDASRYAIGEPYLEIKDGKGTLVSTNGKALAHIPVEIRADDVAGYVSGDCLAAARRQAKRSDAAEVGLNGCASLPDGSTMPRVGIAKDAQFPNWRQVIPKDADGYTVEIALDARMLWELAQAMGTVGVKIRSKPDGLSPLLISPTTAGTHGEHKFACADAAGVLMPVRTT